MYSKFQLTSLMCCSSSLYLILSNNAALFRTVRPIAMEKSLDNSSHFCRCTMLRAQFQAFSATRPISENWFSLRHQRWQKYEGMHLLNTFSMGTIKALSFPLCTPMTCETAAAFDLFPRLFCGTCLSRNSTSSRSTAFPPSGTLMFRLFAGTWGATSCAGGCGGKCVSLFA
jgi:hypothetical protein